MAQFKSYVNIERFKEKYVDAIQKGDMIHCSEKLDGANASFTYDPSTNSIKAFSRKNELSPMNTLRGFYEWVTSIPVDLVKTVTDNGRLVILGSGCVRTPSATLRKYTITSICMIFGIP